MTRLSDFWVWLLALYVALRWLECVVNDIKMSRAPSPAVQRTHGRSR